MTDPKYIAHLDQQLALGNDLLDRMVDHVRDRLDRGMTPEQLVVQVTLTADEIDPGRVSSAFAVALVRLARQHQRDALPDPDHVRPDRRRVVAGYVCAVVALLAAVALIFG
ncbi:hypothetical protein, partial [Micromonospora sp. KC723]|uniref:hypothetical protein n=2 Tax=unclassified Micromonospora TaxID=2617518 RepID=UPI00104A858B